MSPGVDVSPFKLQESHRSSNSGQNLIFKKLVSINTLTYEEKTTKSSIIFNYFVRWWGLEPHSPSRSSASTYLSNQLFQSRNATRLRRWLVSINILHRLVGHPFLKVSSRPTPKYNTKILYESSIILTFFKIIWVLNPKLACGISPKYTTKYTIMSSIFYGKIIFLKCVRTLCFGMFRCIYKLNGVRYEYYKSHTFTHHYPQLSIVLVL